MTNWDDRRIFLVVAQEGSVKKAADKLGVNRTTVLRRIGAFEEELGVRLFERLPNGYFTTAAGEEILRSAQRMSEEANTADRRVAGSDALLSGKIRVALPAALATHLLMPHFADFRRAHPDIKLEILTSYSMVDLAQRKADVAIRMSNNPPEDLVGRRVGKIAQAGFVCADFLPNAADKVPFSDLNWIGWSDDPSTMQWLHDSDHPDLQVDAIISDPYVMLEAVKAGVGMAMLPCFLGDVAPGLYRMPPGNLHLLKDLWILTHEDLRSTARIRKFSSFMADALLLHRDLLEGKCEGRSQKGR